MKKNDKQQVASPEIAKAYASCVQALDGLDDKHFDLPSPPLTPAARKWILRKLNGWDGR